RTVKVDLHDLKRLSGGNGNGGAGFHLAILQRDFALRLSGFGLLINRQMRRNIGFLDAGSTPLTAGVRATHTVLETWRHNP
ncbi:hypothetical protein, partial [Mesorhizobium sp. B1-1-1]|uniref:hypothetical protein n=1 Tax=Mesorhizobium sp. B1-1-1 TaxID=2589983 RepID=UPI0015E306BC